MALSTFQTLNDALLTVPPNKTWRVLAVGTRLPAAGATQISSSRIDISVPGNLSLSVPLAAIVGANDGQVSAAIGLPYRVDEQPSAADVYVVTAPLPQIALPQGSTMRVVPAVDGQLPSQEIATNWLIES